MGRQLDKNEDGYLTADELEEMRQQADKDRQEKEGLPAPKDAIDKALKLYDDNKDGKLSAKEFGNLIKETKKDEMEAMMRADGLVPDGGKLKKRRRRRRASKK